MSAWTMTTGRAILRRWIMMPAALASVTAGTGLLAAAPQAALATITPAVGPIVSGYHQTKCVDDLGNATKNDTPVVISDCNGSAEQSAGRSRRTARSRSTASAWTSSVLKRSTRPR